MSALSKVKVTNSTTKKELYKELDATALLSVTRTQLDSFMQEDEVFLGKDDKPITSALENSTKLAAIAYTNDPPSIKVAKGTQDSVPEPDSDPEDDGDDPTDGGDDPGVLNDTPFKDGFLTPRELPEYEWAEDKVGLEDGVKDGKPVKSDKVSEMKVGQVRKLLKANRIDLNKQKYGIAAAFVDVGNLSRAAYDAVHCTEVEVKPVEVDRITHESVQYSERISRLHRASTSEGQADIGIPGIFRGESAYRHDHATRTDKRVALEHKSFSHIIPKARVVFRDDKISLSDDFISRIRAAVNTERAEALLEVLGRYGQFFASDMLLGGRLNYWSTKKLEDAYTETQDYDAFRLAVSARGAIDGVPVEGSTGWSTGLSEQEKNIAIRQSRSLDRKWIGGNENAVSPETWVRTVAKYLNWKVIGFNQRSLVPTLNYLQDGALRAKCLKLLRRYFTSHLQFRTTALVGATHETPFGYDAGDVKRIVQIQVNHGINIDGLQVTYELTNGQQKAMPWIGWRHGEHTDIVGPLAFDEEIASIEVGAKTLLRRLAFTTTTGRRFPESPSAYYGRGEPGEQLDYTTIEAPRVCGLVGHVGNLIDSVGLRYRELAEGQSGPTSRDFLLEMEPYLFPSNVQARIDMTVRGILQAGKWRTEDALNRMSPDDKRNTLIVVLSDHSNQSVGYLQGCSDAALAAMGALVVCLMTTGMHEKRWLQGHNSDDHRNALIVAIAGATDEDVARLQGLSNQELVRWGLAINGGTEAIGAGA